MNEDLIKEIDEYIEKRKQLFNYKENLDNRIKSRIKDNGWIIDRNSFFSYEKYKKYLSSLPEDDWEITLKLPKDLNILEIRKIDNVYYKPDDIQDFKITSSNSWYYPSATFKQKFPLKRGTTYILVTKKDIVDKNNKTYTKKIKDFYFEGYYITFSPQVQKILICGHHNKTFYEVRLNNKRNQVMECLEQQFEKSNQRILNNPAFYLTSPDGYERHLAEKMLKEIRGNNERV